MNERPFDPVPGTTISDVVTADELAGRAGEAEPSPRAAGVIPWVGVRRVAVVPVFDRLVDQEPPADWEYQIRSRLYYDPDPVTGQDRSFQHYLQAISGGRATLDGQIFPGVWSDGPEVNIPAMRSLPSGHGFTHLVAILPHSFGNHRSGHAFMDVSPVNGITSWARIAMFTDRFLTMRQPLGVWAMEILHMETRFTDLYFTNPNLGAYDVMADASATTHPSAHTKTLMGWLPNGYIHQHVDGNLEANLHAIALTQPPPPGRVTAVRLDSQQGANHFMIEARVAVDQYEQKQGAGDGLPAAPGSTVAKDGVIVYEVADPFSVFLRAGALGPGERYENPDEGLRVVVNAPIAGGFGVSIQKSLRRLVNRTGQHHAPGATGAPTAVVIPAMGVQNIAYRDGSGRLHELWRDAGGSTGTSNLTALANAPAAVGNPFAYVDTTVVLEILLYRATDGHVHSLYWSTGAVGHDNLSGSAGAPKAAGNPVGYFVASQNLHHVIYRTGAGHLEEMWWVGTGAVGHGDLTALASAPVAAGDPAAIADPVSGFNLVFYRGSNGHIYDLYWSSGPVNFEDLSGFAGTPPAAGDPVAYYTAHDDTKQITYRSGNGHLHELFWAGNNPVAGWDLTAAAGAPPAASDPAAYYSIGTNTKHVIYRSSNGRLHEIWWVPGGGTPAHVDLTAFAGAPLAADKPAAFTVEGPNSQHVAYRATDNNIYEIRW